MRKGSLRFFSLGVVLTAIGLTASSSAAGATITPNTFSDEYGGSSSCSLREAVSSASMDTAFGGCSAGSGADTIPLAAGTYVLSIPPDGGNDDNGDGDLDPDGDMTITHSGLAPTVISGGGIDRVLHVQNLVSVSVSSVTIRDGRAGGNGGGILNDGTLDLSNTTVANNETTGSYGGGISNKGDALTLTNVTVSGNRAESDSGGIDQDSTGPVNLNNVTITNNVADTNGDGGTGGGIYRASGPVNLRNTIIAGNFDNSTIVANRAPDCDALSNPSQGNNLIGDATQCDFTPVGGDKVNVNPLLGPLADNGGSTFTHALALGSPAINAAGPGAAATDQRGLARSTPDIGAYEYATCAGKVVNRVGTAGPDTLVGTSAADGILALDGKDKLSGLAGKDGLCGGNGKDKLKGGGGKDKLLGQGGKDTLIGGKGKDVCKGGAGKDKLKSC
jgi:CSLREA domain-containing protein